jgi:hypothetical protein
MRIRMLGLLVLTTSPLCAEVEIRVAGDRVSLHAVSAPVSEILDRFARQTGMQLTYDAARPRQPLTATLENRTPAEAILSLLEGLGLNYALVMDRSGARVEQLLILGTVAGAAAPARPTPPVAQRATPRVEEQNTFVEEEDEEDTISDDVEELEAQEAAQPSPAGPAPSAAPPPPEYPSSAFSPRLPIPTPPPTPSPPPNPEALKDQ